MRRFNPTASHPARAVQCWQILVGAAMRAGMHAGIALGAERGLLRISAGNYGGKLGPFHFHLRRLLGEVPA